jgi:methyl coenzyme M reductase gamma subunit
LEHGDEEGSLTMDDAIGLAEALLGLDGFRVLEVQETDAEVVATVETDAEGVACATCGVRAEAQDRVRVDLRDLPVSADRRALCG